MSKAKSKPATADQPEMLSCFTLDPADDGSFKTDMLVWAKGMGAWTKAGEVPELSDLFGPPPLPGAADDGPPPLP